MDDEYEKRVEATGWRRLALALHSQGTISSLTFVELMYPTEEMMEQAESGELP
jgi:hypothetical protein